MAESEPHESTLVDMLSNLEYDLQRNLLTKGHVPSLKYMTLLKIITSVWHAKLDSTELKLITIEDFIKNINTYELEIAEMVSPLKLSYCKLALEPIIKSVGKEIKNFFFYQIYCLKSATLGGGIGDLFTHQIISATLTELKIYWNNIYWTQQGTIDTLNTAVRIINNTRLLPSEEMEVDDSSIEKQKLEYNLIEKIGRLHELFPEAFAISESKVEVKNCNLAFLVLFSKEDVEKYSKFVKESKYFDVLIILRLFMDRKGAAVQYMWEQLVKERWLINKVLDICYWYTCPSIVLYTCQKMNRVQVKYAKVSTLCLLMEKFHCISQWCNEVSVPQYLHELVRTKDYKSMIEIIRHCWLKDLIDLNDLKQFSNLFRKFVSHFKNQLFDKYMINGNYKFEEDSSKLTDFKILLIRESNFEEKKELIFSAWVQHFCLGLITSKGLDDFEMFITQVLETEQISVYKEKLFDTLSIGMNIYFRDIIVIKTNYYDLVDKILLYLSDIESVNELRKTLPYTNNAFFVFEFLNKTKDDIHFLRKLNEFFNWCFDGNKEEQIRCKAILFDLEPLPNTYMNIIRKFFRILKDFIKHMKWKLMEEYFKWIFFATKETITAHNEIVARMKTILHSAYGDENLAFFALLKWFIISCFSQNESEKLIDEFMSTDDFSVVISNALKLEKHQDIDDLLNWCYSSDKDKIDEFEKKFMKSFGCSLLFELIVSDFKEDKVKSLIEWFNPSLEAANAFKDNFLDFISNKRKSQVDDDEGVKEKEIDWKSLDERVDEILKLLVSHAEGKTLGMMKKVTIDINAEHLLKKLLQE